MYVISYLQSVSFLLLLIIIFVRWLTVNGNCRVVKSSFVPKYLKTRFCQVYVQFIRPKNVNQSEIISALFLHSSISARSFPSVT